MHKVTRRTMIASAVSIASLSVFGPLRLTGQNVQADENATWDLTEIYKSDEQWQAARQSVIKQLPLLAVYRGKLGESANVLQDALVAISDLRRTILTLDTYATLLSDEDMRVAGNQQKRQLAADLQNQLDEAAAWVLPEVIALGPARINSYLSAQPNLKRFSLALTDMLRRAPHTLSTEEEALLAAAGKPLSMPGSIQREVLTSRMPPSNVTLSDGRSISVDDRSLALVPTLPDVNDRKIISDAYWASFSRVQGPLGATLNASIQGDVFNAQAHRYKNSLDAALFAINIPIGAYQSMLTEVNSGLPVLHRYYKLRKKTLGLSELQPYDLNVPLATIGRTFSLPEIRSITLEAVAPLGPVYQSKLANATKARWMDAYPRPGKRPGGYCNPGAYAVHPYVLLNVTNSYAGATEFAHEWGHAMHAVFAAAAQPFDTFNAAPFVQEVASTCNEQLLVNYMIRTATTKQEKIFYLGQQMENFANVFFRQAMKAEFEASLHEATEKSRDLTGEEISEMYRALMLRYYGDSVNVGASYATEWARQPQYYTPFYIFQYVIAITGAVYFSNSMLNGGTAERDRYLTMLKQGGSNYGYEILRNAGMDLASPFPYRQLLKEFVATLVRAEDLIG